MPGNHKFPLFHLIKIAPKFKQGKSEGFDSGAGLVNLLKLD